MGTSYCDLSARSRPPLRQVHTSCSFSTRIIIISLLPLIYQTLSAFFFYLLMCACIFGRQRGGPRYRFVLGKRFRTPFSCRLGRPDVTAARRGCDPSGLLTLFQPFAATVNDVQVRFYRLIFIFLITTYYLLVIFHCFDKPLFNTPSTICFYDFYAATEDGSDI